MALTNSFSGLDKFGKTNENTPGRAIHSMGTSRLFVCVTERIAGMDNSIEDTAFLDELNQPALNVPRAALSFARAIAYPRLDIAVYMSRLDNLADRARPLVNAASTLADRADALSDFLFSQMEFRGNRDRYYDPRNSFLNAVLDRKLGIPITLSILYVAVAQRLGLRAYGIGLPGHFITGLYDDGAEVYLDPFNAGLRLSTADCARLVRESTGYKGAFHAKWLAPVSPVDVLSRMLTNLTNAYIQNEDWKSAIPVIQHLLLVQPDLNFHLRDLGYLYLYNGSLRQAARYLEEYLRRSPEASDFDTVRSSLQIVAGRLALWN
jgi:regulator of sirC expression with transglutaminase-like and TPR domain